MVVLLKEQELFNPSDLILLRVPGVVFEAQGLTNLVTKLELWGRRRFFLS